MRELIAVILLLMIFATGKADEPIWDVSMNTQYEAQVYYVNQEGGTRYHTRRDCPSMSEKYYNGVVTYTVDELPQGLVECQICKDDASQQTTAPQATLSAGTYIVGVDIPQGLYDFIGDENADGVLTICTWDGCVEKSWQVSAGWQGTANLSNEQTLKLPQGCQAVWHLALATSEYDTGTRNLRLNEAGIYQEGRDLAAGLYIVQNNGNATTTVSLLNSADGTLLQSWSVEPGVMITLYLREAYSVQITEGCILRSMTTKWLMQQGQQESIIHGRYSTMMQLPKREYTVVGQDDDACVKVTNLQQNETVTYDLSKGETLQLDLRSYDRTEYLVEFMHVDVSWNKADG